MFVLTNIILCLSQQKFCRVKHTSVATRDVFFDATNTCLSRQKWYMRQLLPIIIFELPEPKPARAAYTVVELRHTSWRMAETSTNYVLANGWDKYQLCPGEWLRQVPIMSWRMAQANTNYVLAKDSDKYQLCPGEWHRQVPIMSWRMAETSTNYVLANGWDKYQLCPGEWLRQIPIMSWRRTQISTNYVLAKDSDKYQLCPGEWHRQVPVMPWRMAQTSMAQARANLSIQQFLSFTMGSDNGLDKS